MGVNPGKVRVGAQLGVAIQGGWGLCWDHQHNDNPYGQTAHEHPLRWADPITHKFHLWPPPEHLTTVRCHLRGDPHDRFKFVLWSRPAIA